MRCFKDAAIGSEVVRLDPGNVTLTSQAGNDTSSANGSADSGQKTYELVSGNKASFGDVDYKFMVKAFI